MVNYASVAYACGVFAWRGVFYCFYKDFDGVFSSAQIDYFKSLFYDVCGFGFFARVLSRSHEAVYESFDNVDACFAEALMLMASHAVGCGHGCQVEVSLESYIFDLNVFEAPFLEKFDFVWCCFLFLGHGVTVRASVFCRKRVLLVIRR